MRKASCFVLLLAVLALLPGCRKEQPAPAGAPDQSASAAQPASPASTPGGGVAVDVAPKPVPAELPAVLARVNGVAIERAEFEMAISTLEAQARAAVPPEQRDSVYRQVLDRLIGYRLLVQEAKRRNITPAPWEVDRQLGEMQKQFPSAQAFEESLKQQGLTFERLREDTIERLAINTMLQAEVDPLITIDDAATRSFYDANRARFREGESVRASHILIQAPPGMSETERMTAKALIESIQQDLKQGRSFADLARIHSQDPGSAAQGGDLGFFARGQMVPAFDRVAFSLKKGQTSGVVETSFGYHLIRVTDHRPERELPFDDVKGKIAEYLLQQQREEKGEAFIEQLRAKAKVDILI
ncbi:MAG: peptidylprolyl isomerase [Acidobacteriota bacterium]